MTTTHNSYNDQRAVLARVQEIMNYVLEGDFSGSEIAWFLNTTPEQRKKLMSDDPGKIVRTAFPQGEEQQINLLQVTQDLTESIKREQISPEDWSWFLRLSQSRRNHLRGYRSNFLRRYAPMPSLRIGACDGKKHSLSIVTNKAKTSGTHRLLKKASQCSK